MIASLLVAGREIRQILATRGFWVMLLIVPAALGASIVASVLMSPQPTVAYTLIDASESVEGDQRRFLAAELKTLAAELEELTQDVERSSPTHHVEPGEYKTRNVA